MNDKKSLIEESVRILGPDDTDLKKESVYLDFRGEPVSIQPQAGRDAVDDNGVSLSMGMDDAISLGGRAIAFQGDSGVSVSVTQGGKTVTLEFDRESSRALAKAARQFS